MPGRTFSCLGPAAVSLLVLVAAHVSFAAGSHQRGAKNVQSFLEMRQERVVIQQWDLSCGAAALATVLNQQHGETLTERHIAEAMLEQTDSKLVQKRLGFSLLDLKRFAESLGYAADGYGEMTLEDLVEFGPAIVPVHIHTYDHFVVFRGVRGGRVLLADPAYGNRTMRIWEFEKVWEKKIAFIVTRPDGVVIADHLSPASDDFNFLSMDVVRAAIR